MNEIQLADAIRDALKEVADKGPLLLQDTGWANPEDWEAVAKPMAKILWPKLHPPVPEPPAPPLNTLRCGYYGTKKDGPHNPFCPVAYSINPFRTAP